MKTHSEKITIEKAKVYTADNPDLYIDEKIKEVVERLIKSILKNIVIKSNVYTTFEVNISTSDFIDTIEVSVTLNLVSFGSTKTKI